MNVETRKKLSEANKGKKLSEVTKKKLSEISKRRWKDLNFRKKNTGMSGYHHTIETKERMSKAQKGKHNIPCKEETKLKISKAEKGRKISEEHKRKIISGSKEHQKVILDEIERLRKEGYKTLNGDLQPRPDIIARKDGKVIAIEVEFRKYPNYEKYNNINFFDDIHWIRKTHGGGL